MLRLGNSVDCDYRDTFACVSFDLATPLRAHALAACLELVRVTMSQIADLVL